MKKLILSLLFTLCSMCIFSLGKAPDVVSGYISFYGNDPFIYTGLKTDDGKEYSLIVAEGSKFSIDDINKNQGKKIELTGTIKKARPFSFNALKDGYFYVDSFTVR